MGKALKWEKDYVGIGQKYAEDVVSGAIPACRWIKLACQRQIDDRERARKGWHWRFDEDKASKVCYFIERLPHIKGRWKTKTLVLEPHQCWRLTTIFGWVDSEGLRRFRKALTVIPRKNAKTTEAAGVGLYMLGPDEEPGAEVYSAATTRDQAKICWDIARKMVQRSEGFRNRYGIEPLAHSIAIESEASFFKPLSRDADSLEGLNPHGVIIDELHAHKTREVFDVLDEATGARKQPLIYIISTEADDSTGVFAEQVSYGQQVLEGNHQDDSFFFAYYSIDAEDDWTDRKTWAKANPNMGVSVFEKDLEIRCLQAQKNAASQASFLTKRLNVRVGAGSAYFNMLAWTTICQDTALKLEQFVGDPCIITIDLASKRDLTTKIRTFRRGATYYVFGTHYLHEEAVTSGNENYDFYRGWAKEGHLILTPGNTTDYEYLERDLLEDMAIFKPDRVGVDPNYNANHFSNRMQQEGVPMVDVHHNVKSFSEPMKSLDAMIVAGRIKHNGDPVLAWAMSNVVATTNAKEDVYPRKSREENKIDPAVALIANISLQFRQVAPSVSVYANRETAVI